MTIKDTYFVQKTLLEYINLLTDRNLHIFLNSVQTIYNLTKNIDESLYRGSENSKTKIKNFSKITTPVKKINFYTSCAFEGCDIYDPDGLCMIICNTNISTTILDIATKVRQVCGRLRDSKYKDQCYLILNTSKHRYAGTTKQEFEEYVKESEKLGRKRAEVISSFDEDLYNSELRTYNQEKYGTIYLNKYHDKIFYDENLKKMDITILYQKFTIILFLLLENVSMVPINKAEKSDNVKPWILERLTKSDYTYKELEEIFTPIFKQHGLKWNSKTSIKYYFPDCKKKKKTVDNVREIHYIFE